jgi:hypothetical protein
MVLLRIAMRVLRQRQRTAERVWMKKSSCGGQSSYARSRVMKMAQCRKVSWSEKGRLVRRLAQNMQASSRSSRSSEFLGATIG